MLRAEKLTKTIVYIFCCLTVLRPIPQLPLLTTFLRIAMFAWLSVNFYWAFGILFCDIEIPFYDLVGILFFLFSILTYIVAIVESVVERRNLCEFKELRCQLHASCVHHLQPPDIAIMLSRRMCIIVFILLLCELVKFWVIFTTFVSPIAYPLVLIDLGTQARFLQIMTTIMELNLEARNVISLLEKLVAQNKRKSRYGSDIWRPYTPKEYEQLNLLRLLYGQLYSMYGCVENCFGWSMFMIIMQKFFFFVGNFFWCVQMSFEEDIAMKMMYNLSKGLNAVILIATLCAVTSDMEAYVS